MLILLKNIHKRMYLAASKRALGISVLGHGSKRRHKSTGGTAGPGKTELVPGAC